VDSVVPAATISHFSAMIYLRAHYAPSRDRHLEVHVMFMPQTKVCVHERMRDEFWIHHPFKTKKMMEDNSNTALLMLWSAMQPLLPEDFKNVMEVGCQVDSHGPPRTLGESCTCSRGGLAPRLNDTSWLLLLARALELLE
jgi:hypothetical protein